MEDGKNKIASSKVKREQTHKKGVCACVRVGRVSERRSEMETRGKNGWPKRAETGQK